MLGKIRLGVKRCLGKLGIDLRNKRSPKSAKQINNQSVIYDRILEVANSFLFVGLAWSSTYSVTLNPLLIGRSSG